MLSKTVFGNSVRCFRHQSCRLNSTGKVYTDVAKALEDVKDDSVM